MKAKGMEFSYEHIEQMDCSHYYLGASAEVSPLKPASGKFLVSDGEMEDLPSNPRGDVRLGCEGNCVFSVAFDKVIESKCADILNVPASTVKSVWATENSSEIAQLENVKRPSSNHSVDEVEYKRARHERQIRKLEEFLETPVSITFDGKPYSDIHDEPEGMEATTASESSAKNFCLTCNGGELESGLDQHDQPSFPGYYGNNSQRTRFYQIEGLYSPCSEYFHWKNVPIGPDHQADVPEYRSCCQSGYSVSSPQKHEASSADDLEIEGNNANKWLGTCVLPTPDLGSIDLEAESLESRFDCDCPDAGSIKCVRNHVIEARESLERTMGIENFMELGFCDMGEIVAKRWTKEEQNLFLQVVSSHPASLGRNFWPLLSHAFPSRSGKELVGYYFNVFILRKRAEQNRSGSLNVDSDNDEWQESSEDELAMSGEEEEEDEEEEEEEEYSVVESPFDANETDSEEYNQCLVDCEDDGLKTKHSRSLCDKRSFGDDDLDAQDDSCTSFEGQFNAVKNDHESLNSDYRNDLLSSVNNYDYIDVHRDSKLCDINYIGATEKVVEFLPTSHVIEEMLGKESLEEDDGVGRL